MTDRDLDHQDQVAGESAASSAYRDYFTILTNVISEVSRDPTQQRKLVYALARLKAEALLSLTSESTTLPVKMLLKLEHTLELEEAIDRIEAMVRDEPHKLIAAPRSLDATKQFDTLLDDDKSTGHKPKDLDEIDLPLSQTSARSDSPTDLAVIIPPAQPPIRLPQLHGMLIDQLPPWLDRIRSTLHRLEYDPKEKSYWIRPGLLSFLQLTAAVVFGVALYVGVAGWVQISRQSTPNSAQSSTATTAAASAAAPPSAMSTMTVHGAQAPLPAALQAPPLPFPVPTSFGVYAVNGDKLIELTKLPIKIPDPRILVSAEISQPSHAVVESGDVKFIVFRRDLVNSAPSTASVRVVARVTRNMKFVHGKPTYVPLPHSWRIRAKSFDFNVSPLQGRPEMILIRPAPGVDLPAGRYALDLNGYGYDFTVAGPVKSPDQCLEQVEVTNGSVLSPCSEG